jgi:hypothetical protein
VLNTFKKISLSNPTQELEDLVVLAKSELPIVLHIRLGDYLKEKDFGILGPNYYSSALKELESKGVMSKIWIFSDDIVLAKSKYGHLFEEDTKWISNELESSAETIELMRYGSAFVLANSTFSWWGAVLAYKSDPVVIAPKNWFQNKKEPKELIPQNWIRIDSDF